MEGLKVLYCHVGVYGKSGWGRTFNLASSLAGLGCNVDLITISDVNRFGSYKMIDKENIKIFLFPDFLPRKLKKTGFGLISLFYKVFFIAFRKYDLVISDCGHRPSSIPAFISQLKDGSVHITEWWDFFGEGGYYNKKPLLFKLTYGWLEKYFEIKSKLMANGVVVLSNWMFNKASQFGIENVKIIHGGTLHKKVPIKEFRNEIIKIAYIGISDSELFFMKPFLLSITNSFFIGKFKFIGYGEEISEKFKKKFGLDECIYEDRGWLNYEKDLDSLSDIDLFLLIREPNNNALAGWPNKLGDYLSFGRAVFINPYGDLEEFVDLNSSGFVKVSFNESSITEELMNIFYGKYDLRLMGERNKILSETMSWNHKGKDLINFYQDIKNKII